MRHFRMRTTATAVLSLALALPLAAPAAATPISLRFLPPKVEARDVCGPATRAPGLDRVGTEGNDEELTDPWRIRFLRRDIRNYAADDPVAFFDFITALIERRQNIDPAFTPEDAIFARINLMLTADREAALTDAGLVPELYSRTKALTGKQKVALARFYDEGTGVPADPAIAQELLLSAAYNGNADALLEIANLAQQGELIEGWDAPLDLTITMALGGILGGLDRDVCRRAERIAQQYITGETVAPNPALALAWFRFAADLGGAEAAWRVVEWHLNADQATQDNLELRRYLELAIARGVALDAGASAALVSSGAVAADELTSMLGHNHAEDAAGIAPHLQLIVNIDGERPDDDGLYLDYLREIAEMPEAPGRVFHRLAREVLVKRGRWAGETEARALLQEAVARGDGPATQRLARILVRYRDDPAMIARADSLFAEAVSRHGMPGALADLDRLYRCQVNDAPRLDRAQPWADAYAATHHKSLAVTHNDLLALAPGRAPERIARVQTMALDGRTQMLASQAQRVQADPLASETALRLWAARLNRSDQALEAFAELEFALARSPAARDQAVEFFRRVHINNGVTTALDLAVALLEYNGRDPAIAAEIERLLTQASYRGEGAALRLLSRLQADHRPEAEVYAQFAETIEARGDFLAMMFAIPHLPADRTNDYIDRAVSLMACGTKDAAELADAYTILANAEGSFHWQRIGLVFDGGHVLAKLRLSDPQMGWYKRGSAPDPVAQAQSALAEGDASALLRLIRLTADPSLPSYDAEAAATHMLTAFQRHKRGDAVALADLYLDAPQEVRRLVTDRTDITAPLSRAAEAGSARAAHSLGELAQATAQGRDDLARALAWYEQAAEAGYRDAMYEAGALLALGIRPDAPLADALRLLSQAEAAGHPNAAQLARLLRAREQG